MRERAKVFFAKLISMKGFVFVTGTALLTFGMITPEVWLGLATLVVGIRAVEKQPWRSDGA